MGYQIAKERKPYIITGRNGTEYQIPEPSCLDLDDAEALIEFNESKDAKRKGEICKQLILKYAPELVNENIGDVEYFMIFQDYNATYTYSVGES